MRRIHIIGMIALSLGCKARSSSELRADQGAATDEGPAAAAAGGATPIWTLDDALIDTPESVYHPGGDTLFVSSMAGAPGGSAAADGKGWIAQLTIDPFTGYLRGKPSKFCCDVPLNSPKGMRLSRVGGKAILWVADIDRVFAIEKDRPDKVAEIKVPGAIGLNDTATDDDGHVFVSDIAGGKIFVVDAKTKVATEFTAIASPNGLLVDGGKLWVLAWGEGKQNEDFTTEFPGVLWEVALLNGKDGSLKAGKAIKHALKADGVQVATNRNFDGLEKAPGGFWISNFTGNTLERIDTSGKEFRVTSSIALPGGGGAGDIALIPSADTQLVFVPRSFGGTRPGLVEAYRVGAEGKAKTAFAAEGPAFPRTTFPLEAVQAIPRDLFSKYCTDCHGSGITGDMRGISGRELTIAANASVIHHVLDWETNKGLTMPEDGSTNRSNLAANAADRKTMMDSLKPFVAAPGSEEDQAVKAGFRRGVQTFGTRNAADKEAAVTRCKQEEGYAKNNVKGYCHGKLETVTDPNSCGDAFCDAEFSSWSCSGRFAWLCRPDGQ